MRDHGGGVAEIHYDTDPLATGTHKAGGNHTGALYDPGAYFRTAGIPKANVNYDEIPGGTDEFLMVENVTQGWYSYVWISPQDGNGERQISTALFDWTVGDTYKIYKTKTKGSKISTIYTDRIYGQKVTRPEQLHKGHPSDDVDLDIDNRNVFGPGQPERH